MQKYILEQDGKTARPADLMEWAKWFENTPNRHLGQDVIGDVRISTVFLGIDHSFGHGPALLWETMIFGGPHDGYQERYATYEEAAHGHREALDLASKEN